jgi:hypothetical protein
VALHEFDVGEGFDVEVGGDDHFEADQEGFDEGGGVVGGPFCAAPENGMF